MRKKVFASSLPNTHATVRTPSKKEGECAIAKVAKAQCQPPSKDAVPTTQDPNTIADFHRMPVRTGILTVASLFFGFTAVKCIRALVHLSMFKVGAGDVLWQDVEKRGDLLLAKYKDHVTGMKTEFGKMERYFYAGIAWSVIFMIVQFVASFKS
jgi:hypothetical protein